MQNFCFQLRFRTNVSIFLCRHTVLEDNFNVNKALLIESYPGLKNNNEYMYKNPFPDMLHMFPIEQNDNNCLPLHAKRMGSVTSA